MINDFNKFNTQFYNKLEDIVSKDISNKIRLESIIHQTASSPVDVKNVIETIKNKLYSINISSDEFQKINSQLTKFITSVRTNEIDLNNSLSSQIDLSIALICDIDADDFNGAMNSAFRNVINNSLPCIISKSTLLGTNCLSIPEVIQTRNEIKKILANVYSEWNVYQQTDSAGNEGMLVFIPKKKETGVLSQAEILKTLDLNQDPEKGSFKKITLDEALIPPKNKVSMDALLDLFDSKPKHSKLFYIAGHGSNISPAGLNPKNYQKLLNLLDEQKCKGLTIASCYSGGTSSLMHIQQEGKSDKKSLNNYSKTRYPVIVTSIGDMPSYSVRDSPDNINKYIEELKKLLSIPGGQTVTQAKAVLQNLNKLEISANSAQIYFPSSADSPAGFRVVGENNKGFDLTYQKMRNKEIEQLNSSAKGIDIDNCKFLQLHPIAVDYPIVCNNSSPILLSLIPGNSHHYIKKITLKDSSFQEFIDENSNFYNNSNLSVQKLFIIEKVVDKDGKIYQGVLFHAKNFAKSAAIRILYLEKDGSIYTSANGVKQKITEYNYRSFLESLLRETTPTSLAVRTQSGGQQSNNDFLYCIHKNTYWNFFNKLDPFVKEILFPDLKNLTRKTLQEILDKNLLSQNDKICLAFECVKKHKFELVKYLINKGDVLPDCKEFRGLSLLELSLHLCSGKGKNQIELVDFINFLLEEKKCSTNYPNILSNMCRISNLTILKDFVLKNYKLPNNKQWYFCLLQMGREKLELLTKWLDLKYFPNDEVNKENLSIVSLAVSLSINVLKEVIHAGFDINAGNPPPPILCYSKK